MSCNSLVYKSGCAAHGYSLSIGSSLILAVRSLFRPDLPADAQLKVRWVTLAIEALWAPVRGREISFGWVLGGGSAQRMQEATPLIVFWICMDSFNFLEIMLAWHGQTCEIFSLSHWMSRVNLGFQIAGCVCIASTGLKLSKLLNANYQVNGMENAIGHSSEYHLRALTIKLLQV